MANISMSAALSTSKLDTKPESTMEEEDMAKSNSDAVTSLTPSVMEEATFFFASIAEEQSLACRYHRLNWANTCERYLSSSQFFPFKFAFFPGAVENKPISLRFVWPKNEGQQSLVGWLNPPTRLKNMLGKLDHETPGIGAKIKHIWIPHLDHLIFSRAQQKPEKWKTTQKGSAWRVIRDLHFPPSLCPLLWQTCPIIMRSGDFPRGKFHGPWWILGFSSYLGTIVICCVTSCQYN